MKKTKIIATIRDTYDEEKLIKIYQSGANVVRFNFPHAQYDTTAPIIQLIHKLNEEGKTNLGIMVDTKGPGVRTGVRENPYQYQQGEKFRIFVDESLMTEDSDMSCDYPYLIEDIKIGSKIEIESGLMEVKVLEINQNFITVVSSHTFEIGSRRHMNFPGLNLRFPGLTDQDKKDLLFSIEQGIEYVAISFVRTGENIQEVRDFLHEHNANHVQIIAKIENQEGLDNAEEIAKKADGIMIARGDLGIEVPTYKLPFYQRYLLDICQKWGKTAIMATELLKTMVNSPIPTRAEISDVYNSVIQGANVLMLSEETAIGNFPSEAVHTMAQTAEEAEIHLTYPHSDFELIDNNLSGKKALVKHALSLADEIDANYILVFTHSGNLTNLVAALRPNQPVFACCPDEKVVNGMQLLGGIVGIQLPEWKDHTSENQDLALRILKDKNLIYNGDKIIIIGDKKRGEKTDPLIRITTVD